MTIINTVLIIRERQRHKKIQRHRAKQRNQGREKNCIYRALRRKKLKIVFIMCYGSANSYIEDNTQGLH